MTTYSPSEIALIESILNHIKGHSCVATCCDAQPSVGEAKALANCVAQYLDFHQEVVPKEPKEPLRLLPSEPEQVTERTEGWGSLDNAPGNAHYFVPSGESLCRRWQAIGAPRWETNQELGPEPKRGSGTCKACWKKRTAVITKQGQQP